MHGILKSDMLGYDEDGVNSIVYIFEKFDDDINTNKILDIEVVQSHHLIKGVSGSKTREWYYPMKENRQQASEMLIRRPQILERSFGVAYNTQDFYQMPLHKNNRETTAFICLL